MSPASHLKNPALQDSYRIFNQDCELVSQLPIYTLIVHGKSHFRNLIFILKKNLFHQLLFQFCITASGGLFHFLPYLFKQSMNPYILVICLIVTIGALEHHDQIQIYIIPCTPDSLGFCHFLYSISF